MQCGSQRGSSEPWLWLAKAQLYLLRILLTFNSPDEIYSKTAQCDFAAVHTVSASAARPAAAGSGEN